MLYGHIINVNLFEAIVALLGVQLVNSTCALATTIVVPNWIYCLLANCFALKLLRWHICHRIIADRRFRMQLVAFSSTLGQCNNLHKFYEPFELIGKNRIHSD